MAKKRYKLLKRLSGLRKRSFLISLSLLISGFLFASILPYATAGNPSDQGLVLLYHFDRDSSVGENDDFVYDWSNNNNHGTVYGATWNSLGKFGGSLDFDGNDYMEMPYVMSTSQANAHTVALWYRWIDCPSGYCTLIAQAHSLDDNYLYFLIAEPYPRLYNWKKSYAVLPATWNDGNWHHVAYVHPANGDGSSDLFYFDGESLTTVDDTGTWQERTEVWRIGMNSLGDHPFVGSIDEVCVYSRTLSYEEVQQLYGGGSSTNCMDSDGDGYCYYAYDSTNYPGGSDCDDSNPNINPGASEICDNGIDDNCDGIDLIGDEDNDGYYKSECGGTDCDDNNPNVNPGAVETCNSIDDNCNGQIDEGFDADNDGYTICDLPVPDCDDTNLNINPGATEICGDGIDQDCNGEDCPLVSVSTWKDGKKGAASWSIDDASQSCKDALEAAGFRGTYYLNGNDFDLFWKEYADAGHEVSSHTTSHPCYPPCDYPDIYTCDYTEDDVDGYRIAQLEANIYAIESVTGKPVLTLAWPCGCTDIVREMAASYYFLGARGYYDWVCDFDWVQGVENQTPDDFYNLHSVSSYDQTFIDEAISEGKWAIVVSHGSCAGIDYVGSRKDDLYLAPVGEVLKYIMIRDATEVVDYSRTDDRISFTAFHTIPEFVRDSISGYSFRSISFDDEVTLKVGLNVDDGVFDVRVNGLQVSFTIKTSPGNRFVLLNTPLDSPKNVEILMGSAFNCTDSDNDTHYAYDAINCPIGDDCNDTNPDIRPGAVEICGNGIDEDCDGEDLPCEYTVDLHKGWNTLWLLPKPELENISSLNGDYSVENVLRSLNNSYEIVYYHDGTLWLTYVPGSSTNTLETMNNENNYPYWIKMISDGILEL